MCPDKPVSMGPEVLALILLPDHRIVAAQQDILIIKGIEEIAVHFRLFQTDEGIGDAEAVVQRRAVNGRRRLRQIRGAVDIQKERLILLPWQGADRQTNLILPVQPAVKIIQLPEQIEVPGSFQTQSRRGDFRPVETRRRLL
ncbi:MAG: hypothetical protein BWY71_01503 [Planctomycetes bacterium ADurb.Bin412]|nr:MAG: hypothetical protein BWY71_01503 [Planctomycetes bacterium ADurb.Bin412]